MYCPQCGTESSGVQYCRSCGANLKVIGKAVALSEAVARSDRGPLPAIKEMVRGLKVEHVSEEVSKALERMNNEIARISPEVKAKELKEGFSFRRKKTAAERRENNITKGIVSLFSGAGMTVFLYYLSAALVLKLPPDVIGKIPFEIDPVVHVIWLIGLIPMLSGLGHIVSGLLIRPERPSLPTAAGEGAKLESEGYQSPRISPSVTENTTNLLSSDPFSQKQRDASLHAGGIESPNN